MQRIWFKTFGWIYRPVSWQGWFVTILAIAFCLHIFLFVDARTHSVTDTLYAIFPYILPSFLLWVWIAGKSSDKV